VATERQRIALVIQYLGGGFHGWQRQAHHRTVQAEIEDAIAQVLDERVPIHGAGRTDSGVHAAAQVAHFDACAPIPASKWAAILNARLPDDVLIRASAAVPPDWHAQFSALWRRYRYTIYTAARPNLFVQPFCWHYYRQPLDAQRIQAALAPLVGRRELTAFRRAGSARRDSWIEIQVAECQRDGDFLRIELQASGFLYGMVRLLVGMLVEVGSGTRSPESFAEIWQQQQRDRVQYAAPARGLCLLRVGYPDLPIPEAIWFDSQPRFLLPSERCTSPQI